MNALAIVQQGALLSLYIQAVDIALQVIGLLGDENGTLCGGAETYNVLHLPGSAGQLTKVFALCVHKIEVCIAVFPAPVDELAVIPGQEGDGVTGLDILFAGLCVECLQLIARSHIVSIQGGVVLVAIQLEQIQGLAIWGP